MGLYPVSVHTESDGSHRTRVLARGKDEINTCGAVRAHTWVVEQMAIARIRCEEKVVGDRVGMRFQLLGSDTKLMKYSGCDYIVWWSQVQGCA